MGLRLSQKYTGFGVAAIVLGATCSSEALAQEPVRVALSERSQGFGAGCVEKDSVLRGTERAIGRAVFAPKEQADVELVLRVRVDNSATLQLLDLQGAPLGHRNLRAQSCSELTQALTLTLSLMLDFSTADVEELRQREAAPASGEEQEKGEEGEKEKTEEPQEPKPAPTPPHEAPTTSSPKPPRASETSRDWQWAIGVDGRLALGIAPPALYGVGLEGTVVHESGWAAIVDLGYWFPREVRRVEGSTEVQLLQAAGSLCPVLLEFHSWQLWGCAAGSAARVLLRGSGFASDLHGSGWVSQAGVELRPQMPLGPLTLTARAGAWGTLLGYSAIATSASSRVALFESSPITGRFSIGVSVPFD